MTNTTLLLVAIAIIMVVAVPMVVILKDFLPRAIERSSNIQHLENRIYVLHSEVHDLQDRVGNLVANRNRQSAEQHRLEGDIRKIEKAIVDLATQPPLFVHEVGEPQAGASRFTVNLTLERASSAARSSGERAPVNPIWRGTNVAEVWASTYEEAKQLVEVAFPFKLGFTKAFITKPSKAERLAEEARKAVAEKAASEETAA
jgi:hypothetical protein